VKSESATPGKWWFPESLKFSLLAPIFMILLQPAATESVLAQSKPKWQSDWDKTVEAAKREGQVTVYVTLGPDQAIGAFEKAYPDIKLVKVAGRSAQIAQRILAERRAGRYLVDLTIGGGAVNLAQFYAAKMLDPVKPLLLLPEVVDESRWWEGKHKYLDAEEQYIFVFVGVAQNGSIHYNTKLVHPAEFKSLWDFVNPKWRGKIVARDPRAPGPGGGATRFLYHHPEIGPKFLRRLLGEMQITLTRDERLPTDWLATGKFAICFFCREILIAKRQGLPVDSFGLMKEGAGLTSQGGTLALIDGAPHPNAAKVFINWFLSVEGQTTYQTILAKVEGSAPDSLRIDIPKDGVSPEERRLAGVRYVDVDTPERRDMRPIFKLLEETLADSGKK
jgi:iron(III) transport system substrate-binding protein